MRISRPVAIVPLLAAGLALSGCSSVTSLLHETFPDQFGPARGDDGRVTSPVEAHSSYLTVGDCFSFVTEGSTDDVEIVPCDQAHTLEVIGQGTISLQEEKTQGLQVAASAKCAEPFAEFEAQAPEGSRPDQTFLITEVKDGDRTVTQYSCLASLTRL